ncbi:hypothetical protein BDQ17DRAFT_1391200 [Cyathus striatus]|nr:hypothetical protein BDQ17DRAFT_1391200 [Cyathus striatus]
MSSTNSNNISSNNTTQRTAPIPISIPRATRTRSGSLSSASSGSASSAFEPPTPPSSAHASQRVTVPSPGGSPVLSYFLANSPTKNPGTFPFKRKFGTTPVLEASFAYTPFCLADEEVEREIPVVTHARRASTSMASRFTQPQNQPMPDVLHERGSSLLRRLSLSSTAFAKPQLDGSSRPLAPPSPPPNTAAATSPTNVPFSNKPRRSATVSSGETGSRRRAPSPMGERILKGHFDGFN